MLISVLGFSYAQVKNTVSADPKVDSTTVLQHVSDTTKVIKEAPEALKELFEKIVEEETEKAERQKNKIEYSLEIDGLIIDQTKTKSGREFYEYFFSVWEAPENAKNFTIFIEEKPFRLNTTLIEILINETIVFQSLLQPRGDFVENLAIESIGRTQMYLANYEELLKQLGGSDMVGTGIF
nr:curli production assembly/transport protein CsgE [Belliella calami]